MISTVRTMKWYDYFVCFTCADIISTGAVNGSFLLIIFGWFMYFNWEYFRKWEINNG